MTKISFAVFAMGSVSLLTSCTLQTADGDAESLRVSQEALGGCRASGQPTVSKIETPLIGADTVSGPDVLSSSNVIIHFHLPGDTTCYGDAISGTRHFHVPMAPDYDEMTAAIVAGKDIEVHAKASTNGAHFSRVYWKAVNP